VPEANPPKWHIKGEWQDSCSCDIGCPCTFDQIPTLGYCQGLLAYHIEQGQFGDVPLDNLTMLSVGKYGQGRLLSGHWVLGYVFDAKATPAQREALQQIFLGDAGGHFATLRKYRAKVVGIRYLPIEWRRRGQTWGLKVGKSTETKCAPYRGLDTPKGEVVQVRNAPVAEGGVGLPITMGHTLLSRIKLFDFEFEWSERNSKFGPMKFSGP
jgi:hypothetical protein